MNKNFTSIDSIFQFDEITTAKNQFFYRTYKLIARSGSPTPIDLMLLKYPNCILGLHVVDSDGMISIYDNYLIFFRFTDGQITPNDVMVLYFGFVEDGSEFDAAKKMFFDPWGKSAVLGRISNLRQRKIPKELQKYLQEQILLGLENAEPINTEVYDVEDLMFPDDTPVANFIDVTAPLDPVDFQNLSRILN